MSPPRLRPLGIGEILDVAIKAYSGNARTLITIGAVVGVPFELLGGLIQLSTVSSADQVGGSLLFGGGGGSSSGSGTDYSHARLAGVVATSMIGLLIGLVLTAATVKAVSDAYLGKVPSVGDSLRFAVRRIRSLAWLYLVLAVGLVLSALALLLPTVWLYVAWSVATPVLLLEDIRGTAALRRSFRLVRRRWWATAGVLLVAAFITGISGAVVEGVLLVIPHAIDSSSVLLAVIGATIAATIAAALVQPLKGAIITILYFDLRVRKDGLDLSLLASELDLPGTTSMPYAIPERALAPREPSDADHDGDAPPFWPPPPGWQRPTPPTPSAE